MQEDDWIAKRRRQTLDQLENHEWGPPTFDSHLVQTCHRLRTKPIGDFSNADLRIMLGQNIGSTFLAPLALERLSNDPYLEADYFSGDLLCAVLGLPQVFWQQHADMRSQLDEILERLTDPPTIVEKEIAAFRSKLGK